MGWIERERERGKEQRERGKEKKRKFSFFFFDVDVLFAFFPDFFISSKLPPPWAFKLFCWRVDSKYKRVSIF